MIFIIKDADASVNNIGSKVEVPIVWDAAAAAYIAQIPTTLASLPYAKKRALNDFFKGVKSAGFYSKITHLFLPCFGRVEGGVNLVAPAYNINFPTTDAVYDAKGVFFNLGWQVPFLKNIKENHVAAYTSTIPSSNVVGRYSVAQSATNHILGRYVINPDAAGFRVNSSADNATVAGLGMSIGPLIGSVSSSLGKLNASVNGVLASKTITTVGGANDFQLIIGGNALTGTAGLAMCSHSLFSFGDYLTEVELASFASLQSNLMAALLV
ncbi:hypothetical protein [Dyadobacter frigoris]|uniref:Uncharacterized protein n=1 Tax=Dyadobacter frigoris TaxID=2576211 RepID=A0A4U6CXQ7_9BACT|nr:hypothetical protein [Dyadobacter frigoris]TKT89492.1 hypothetical protein FDK13_24425 [Dyadobacter frigoris]